MSEQSLYQVFAGLFGGFGATFLWEALIKPLHGRLHVAEALAVEVSMNMQALANAHVQAHAQQLPTNFELSTDTYDALAGRIAELPSDLLAHVAGLYRRFKRLNHLPQIYERRVDDLRATPDADPHLRLLEDEALQCIHTFNDHVATTLQEVNRVQPNLLATAFPWWSLRRWTRKPSKELALETVMRRVREADARRAALASELDARLGA